MGSTAVRVTTNNNVVRVSSTNGRGGNNARSYQVTVPEWMPISVSNARGDVTIEGAGHFLQEDKGEELANVLIEFINNNRASRSAPTAHE